ncbi:MAG: class I SAM-dependent methyltransferase [Tunicatimonas sp.]
MSESLSTEYFDELYQKNEDPWHFETSAYEREKYGATLAALPNARYQNAFEIGCSIGVLTQQLAGRCEHLLAVDGSEIPLQQARQRLEDQPSVQLEQMRVPDTFPDDTFDLILVSEVGYYWSWSDLEKAQQLILRTLRPGGHLLLVHWVQPTNYPLTGDEVHDAFSALAPPLTHQQHQRTDRYRLDRWERRG